MQLAMCSPKGPGLLWNPYEAVIETPEYPVWKACRGLYNSSRTLIEPLWKPCRTHIPKES